MKQISKIIRWAKKVWLALLNKQTIYTDRKDWSVTYADGSE
jgi:hypothetical protein